MKERLSLLFATVLYIGYLPGPRGTYAAAATTIVYYFVSLVTHRIAPELHLSLLCLITMAGVITAEEVSRQCGHHDPQIVVIDEVAGQLLTFLFLPVNYLNLCVGTALFRLFDIWKPYPIKKAESLKKGVGIMADDLLAGVYANLILQLIAWLLRNPSSGTFLWINR